MLKHLLMLSLLFVVLPISAEFKEGTQSPDESSQDEQEPKRPCKEGKPCYIKPYCPPRRMCAMYIIEGTCINGKCVPQNAEDEL